MLAAGLGVRYLCRTLGWGRATGTATAPTGRRGGVGRDPGGQPGLHVQPVPARVRGPHLGDPAALGRPALDDRPHRPGAAPGRLALPGAVRARRADRRRHQRHRPHHDRDWARCSTWCGRCSSTTRSACREALAHRGPHRRRSPWSPRCGGSPGCGPRASTACRSPGTPRPTRPWPRSRARPRCCAGSATGSSTATTSSGPWTAPSATYTTNLAALTAQLRRARSLAIVAAALVRWRYRALFLGIVVVGAFTAVASHPWSNPSLARRRCSRRSPAPTPAWRCAARPGPCPWWSSAWPCSSAPGSSALGRLRPDVVGRG